MNETLFSLDAVQPVFEAVDLADQRDLWFARTLRTGFALTCAGEYRTFPEVAVEVFRSLAPERIGPSEQDALRSAFGQLAVHPDVQPALQLLHDAEVPVVTLSVGNAANVERLFAKAGLTDLAAAHLSCETVRRWKPAPEPYIHACEFLQREPATVWMVAAHSWDVAGAAAVGMRTAWLSRLEGTFDANFASPDVSGTDLVEVASLLLR